MKNVIKKIVIRFLKRVDNKCFDICMYYQRVNDVRSLTSKEHRFYMFCCSLRDVCFWLRRYLKTE